MGDPLSERVSRYHGGFVDPDGQYKLVSSITKKAVHIQGEKPRVKQEGEDVTSDVTPTTPDDPLFCMRAWGSMLAISIVTACVCYRWMVSKKPRKNGTNKSEGESCSSETAASGLPAKNLSVRFEEVKDSNPYEPNTEEWTKSPIQQRLPESVESEKACALIAFPETMILRGGSQSGRGLGVKELQLRRRRQNSLGTAPRATCPSPPCLVDEGSTDCPQFNSQQALVLTTSTTQPSPMGYDASSLVAINQHSQVEKTPEKKFALGFCRSCDIIEEELTLSNRKLDAYCVQQLAFLHQANQMNERHLQQKISYQARRESFSTVEKLSEYRRELTKIRDKCLANTWGAVRYSLLVILLLEVLWFGSGMKEELQYFSWQNFWEDVLEKACDCEENSASGKGDSNSAQSTFSWATSMLGINNAFMLRILSYGNISLCVLSYVGSASVLFLLNATLVFMQFPAFVCHLFQMAVLVLCLAQNPQVMVDIDSLLQRYSLFAKAQVVTTVASVAMALLGFWHVDKYIVERQKQVRDGRADGEDVSMTTSDARSQITNYECLPIFSQVAPPVIVGLLGLCKEGG